MNLLALVGLLLSLPVFALAQEPIVLADFDGESYGDWVVSGDAFGKSPPRGTLPGQMTVSGFHGNGLVNSFVGGDPSRGTLTSPPFVINRKYIGFLLGGGKDPEKLQLQLLIDEMVVRSATGPNDAQGGSEALHQESWDVADLAGKTARLRIIDEATGGWGHINVDQIILTDTKPKGFQENVEREFKVGARYLHLPIKNGGPKRKVSLIVDGKMIVQNDVELADEDADWWAPLPVDHWKGKSVVIRVDKLHQDSKALADIQQGDDLILSENLYRETLRGQFHFSPRRGWNNDPNGLVYFNGEYHLFFQHNPYGWSWGNMHWGHAVSKDLVHWEELGDVLAPDEMGAMFSGSAVVDWKNTSGFGKPGQPPLVLFYTAAGNPATQCMAYSLDGRNFTKYDKNPIVPQITRDNRDPKVFWHEPTQKWIMVLYVEKPVGRHSVHFLKSENLKEWEVASVTEGDPVGRPFLFECPDFFELPIDNDPSNKKWVLTAANGEYAIGTFDGERFSPETTRWPGHQGRGFYAAQTFSDIPAQDGRRIQIGWFQTETRGMPFNQSMTVPLELGLKSTDDGPRLTVNPIHELSSLRKREHSLPLKSIAPGDPNPLAKLDSELVELRVECNPGSAKEIVFNIRDVMVIYFPGRGELTVDGAVARTPLLDGKLKLTILCDRTGVEVFGADGLTYVPVPFKMNPDNRRLFFEARGGAAEVHSLQIFELDSAWLPANSNR